MIMRQDRTIRYNNIERFCLICKYHAYPSEIEPCVSCVKLGGTQNHFKKEKMDDLI